MRIKRRYQTKFLKIQEQHTSILKKKEEEEEEEVNYNIELDVFFICEIFQHVQAI